MRLCTRSQGTQALNAFFVPLRNELLLLLLRTLDFLCQGIPFALYLRQALSRDILLHNCITDFIDLSLQTRVSGLKRLQKTLG